MVLQLLNATDSLVARMQGTMRAQQQSMLVREQLLRCVVIAHAVAELRIAFDVRMLCAAMCTCTLQRCTAGP